MLSLKIERSNPWFSMTLDKEIMEVWEPDLENQSIRLCYKKKDESGNEEMEVYEYQAQQQ